MPHEIVHFSIIILFKREINEAILNFQIKLVFFFVMFRLVYLSFVLPIALGAVIYIDRFTLDSNKKASNFSVSYTHNKNRNAIVNLTIEILKPLTKLMIYVKVNLAENEHDREYRWEFLRTVVDVDKLFKGAQMNPLVAAYMENMKQFLNFEIQFPFQPVS